MTYEFLPEARDEFCEAALFYESKEASDPPGRKRTWALTGSPGHRFHHPRALDRRRPLISSATCSRDPKTRGQPIGQS
jgi:hypothetical protein